MSKGSKQRPTNIKSFSEGYDRIFKKRANMGYKNEFLEQNQDEINQEWNCYCNKINSIRHEYGLNSKVFTPNDKDRFCIAYIESKLI